MIIVKVPFVICNEPLSTTPVFVTEVILESPKDGGLLPGEQIKIRRLEFSAPSPNFQGVEKGWRSN